MPVDEIRAAREQKITMLYEEYIHLDPIRDTWHNPLTENPRLEPIFVAGMQGVELGFLLLTTFLNDSRDYVVKRPRIEAVAEDIQVQYRLLAEILDGELEDENMGQTMMLGSLRQSFPFPGSPPTFQEQGHDKAKQSPVLELVVESLRSAFPILSVHEQHSVRKVIRNITGTFYSCFSEWSVGIGIEEQLSIVRESVGLPPFKHRFGKQYLDYRSLVRPELVMQTFTAHKYEHKEDFFFRSIHLGTEMWAFIALQRLQSAKEQVAQYNHWDNAAAHIRSAANIFEYLGQHVMMLTRMVLRDYLKLKVEIEGTSGAGSVAVKLLRKTTEDLLSPLLQVLLKKSDGDMESQFMKVYRNPERYPGLYNYVKSLETVESGLLGGFFFKHVCLAKNIIGSGAKGTMKMSVEALKKTYERPLFPVLDFVRAEYGRQMDDELEHRKGKIMKEIESSSFSRRDSSYSASSVSSTSTAPDQDQIRMTIYREDQIPQIFQPKQLVQQESLLSFLDHAWGKIPPNALVSALKNQFQLFHGKGNDTWNELFAELMPEAVEHIKSVLGNEDDTTAVVEFGHNSHEFVTRIISVFVDRMIADPSFTLRILTTDGEFYSFSRQVNRMLECSTHRFVVDVVEVFPSETFQERFFQQEKQASYDLIYVSQTSYLSQVTLVPDVGHFLGQISSKQTLCVLDGYHAFGAVPSALPNPIPENLVYIAGILKHMGSGPNCAFAVMSKDLKLQPLFTGWLSDLSVLGPESAGVSIAKSKVGWQQGLRMMGGTSAFIPALLVFVQVMRTWKEKDITVQKVHQHVMNLQSSFLEQQRSMKPVNGFQPESIRSHTLVFEFPSPAECAKIVEFLRKEHHIAIDSRKNMLRIGFGFNHDTNQVKRLSEAFQSYNK